MSVLLEEKLLAQLETPCIVIDCAKAQENICRMQAVADACHCKLRPHIKTHKMGLFAQMQIGAGAGGITCAKVSEAEIMAQYGIKDIFIAYPMVGEFRIRRAIQLQKQIERLILAVDSVAGATLLNRAAQANGVILEVRMEIDTGAKRTGILMDAAVELAG
ncbi:MAG: alanine racemase, partial [Oscillospiraceae bacterium]